MWMPDKTGKILVPCGDLELYPVIAGFVAVHILLDDHLQFQKNCDNQALRINRVAIPFYLRAKQD